MIGIHLSSDYFSDDCLLRLLYCLEGRFWCDDANCDGICIVMVFAEVALQILLTLKVLVLLSLLVYSV